METKEDKCKFHVPTPESACAVLCLLSRVPLCDPMDCSPPGPFVHGDFPGKNTGVGFQALLQGNLPNSGIEPRPAALQVDSLPSEPPAKPEVSLV